MKLNHTATENDIHEIQYIPAHVIFRKRLKDEKHHTAPTRCAQSFLSQLNLNLKKTYRVFKKNQKQKRVKLHLLLYSFMNLAYTLYAFVLPSTVPCFWGTLPNPYSQVGSTSSCFFLTFWEQII